MRIPVLLVILSLISQGFAEEPLTMEQVRSRGVIGTLGAPIGSRLEVVGHPLRPDEGHPKAYADGPYLVVTAVNGIACAPIITKVKLGILSEGEASYVGYEVIVCSGIPTWVEEARRIAHTGFGIGTALHLTTPGRPGGP